MDSGEIRLENGVLMTPDGLYPLRGISRVRAHTLEVDPKRILRWKILAILWLLFAAFALMDDFEPSVSTRVFRWLLFAAPESLYVWRLYRISHAPPLHALAITSSGTERDVAWSWDGAEIRQLVGEITRALGDGDSGGLHYHYTLRHTVEGDVINQYGGGTVNTRSTTRGDAHVQVSGDFGYLDGDGVVKAVHSGCGDIVGGDKGIGRPEEIARLVREVQLLMRHLDDSDREVAGASVAELSSNPSRARLRVLLQQISGIATLAGEVGAPVIAAVRAIVGSL